MHIGVVGGGIFGVTAAWFLAREGHQVDLFERESDILCGASGINQYRLHRGYHYPRSKETALLSMSEEADFVKHYGDAVITDNKHYYGVAKDQSLVSKDYCKQVWSEIGLEFTEERPDVMNPDALQWCVRGKESLFDPIKLRELCWEKLREHKVNVHLNQEVEYCDLNAYDLVVGATYAYNNQFIRKDIHKRHHYQFELCEKIVVELPPSFNGKAMVILDGPFMCIDPLARTGQFVMGNVVHAIHHTNVGEYPEIPPEFAGLINRGIISNPPLTNFDKFIESASFYFPDVVGAKHVGSMFTIRTVPPHRDHDDARPTIVERASDRVVTIYSGKVGTCIYAGEQVVDIARSIQARTQTVSPSRERVANE